MSTATPADTGNRGISNHGDGARGARRREGLGSFIVSLPAVLLLIGVVVVPLTLIIALSLGWPDWTLAHFHRIGVDPVLLPILMRSLWIAFVVTVLCALLGYPVAYLMVRVGPRARGIIMLMIILPMWTSLLVRTYAWMAILGRRGVVNETLQWLGLIDAPIALLYTRASVYIGMVHVMLPFMILPLYAVMRRIDFRLVAAATSLGASRMTAFFLVFLPLSLPGVLAGSILVFILSIGFFVTPAILGGLSETTFVMLIERQVNQFFNWPLAAAMSVVLVAATLALVIVYNRALAERSGGFAVVGRLIVWASRAGTVLGRGTGQRAAEGRSATASGRQRKPRFTNAAPAVAGGMVLAFILAPIFVVIPLAFSSAPFLTFPPPGFSLRWFETYFSRADWINPTLVSFQIGAMTMLMATVIGTLAAVGIVQGQFRGRRVVTALILAPLMMPTIVLAVSLYYLFARYGIVGTRLALVLAHTAIALPFVFVVVSAALQRLDPALGQAASVLGAGRLQVLRRITLPLAAPAIGVAALFAFLASFDELVVALFLAGTRTTTLPKRMWDSIREEIDPTTAAVATLLIGLSILVLILVELLRRRSGGPEDMLR